MPESPPNPGTHGNDFQEQAPAFDETGAPASAEQEQEQHEVRVLEDDAGENPAQVGYAPEAEAGAGGGAGGGRPPDSGGGGDDGGEESEEEEGTMAKMSFLDHLEELRNRIIYALLAVAIAFFVCFAFAPQIFAYMSEPVRAALREMGMKDQLYFTKPTDAFMMHLNLALVAGLFLASPLVIYQVWAFIAPGLYKQERRYAVPFIFFCSSLFITGGLFGYFIAFPFALKFLLTYGDRDIVTPWITITEYVDMFWTVILGLGIIFELPVLMLFLGLLGILTPGFLMRNFRYAVLLIFIVAAVVTPTSDITNLMIFALPMMVLYLVGVGLVWIVARRRQRREAS